MTVDEITALETTMRNRRRWAGEIEAAGGNAEEIRGLRESADAIEKQILDELIASSAELADMASGEEFDEFERQVYRTRRAKAGV